LIFLTIGLSIILRGGMKLVWGKNRMAVPPLAGEANPCTSQAPPFCPRRWPYLIMTDPGHRPAGAVLQGHATGPGHARRGLQPGRGRGGRHRASGRVKAASFALAAGLGGLAGVLVTPITTLSYDVGVLLGLKGFAAAIFGGFGSFPGAVLGGVGLGLLESLVGRLLEQRVQGCGRLRGPPAGIVHSAQGAAGKIT
jgi:branched-chain amino acid transport system permease protein